MVSELGPLGLPDVLLAATYLSGSIEAASSQLPDDLAGSASSVDDGVDATWLEALLQALFPLLPSCPADRLASLGWSLALLLSKRGIHQAAEGQTDRTVDARSPRALRGTEALGTPEAAIVRRIGSGGGTSSSPSSSGDTGLRKPDPQWMHEWLVCCRSRFRQLDARDLATVGPLGVLGG